MKKLNLKRVCFAFSALAALVSPLVTFEGTAHAQSANLVYEVQALGLTAATAHMQVAVTPGNYSVNMKVSSAGVATMAGFNSQMSSYGSFSGANFRPAVYDYYNKTSKKTERLIATMASGQATWTPRKNIPTNEVIGPNLIASSLDPVTALVALMLQVTQTGRCDGASTIFDGRSVINAATQTLGRSTPSGIGAQLSETPLRCRMTASPVAGKITRPKDAARLIPLDVWMARPAGSNLAVPVKIEGRIRNVPVSLRLVRAG